VPVGPEFSDLQRSPAGCGGTPEEAVKALRSELGKVGYPDDALRSIGEFTVHE
jgi:hypothetical protein